VITGFLARYAQLFVLVLLIYSLVAILFFSVQGGMTVLALALIAALLHEIHAS